MVTTKRMTNILTAAAFAAVLAASPAFAATAPSTPSAPPAPNPLVMAPSAETAVKPKADMAIKQIDDAAITVKVKEALAADPELKALEIKAETNKGEVHLTGKVNTKEEEEKALSLTKKVEGVKSVKSSLTLNTPAKE